MTELRMPYGDVAPAARDAALKVEAYIHSCGLDPVLIGLIKTRASQINKCAFCLDMHTRELERLGENPRRVNLIAAWREAACFSPSERAALAWTESLTNVAETGAPDEDYDGLKAHFTDKEIVDLTTVICMINYWNRLGVGFRLQHPPIRK